MADPQAANALSSAFPPPPPFWQDFTSENVKRVSELRDAQPVPASNAQSAQLGSQSSYRLPATLPELPADLRHLQPPPPPAGGIYRCFGDTYDLNETLPSLEKQGIKQLYDTPDDTKGDRMERADILKDIARKMLLKFLELVGVLSANPSMYKDYIDDLRTLFINFHHLLNEYRPHQARESLIRLMEEQLERTKKETNDLTAMKEKVEGILSGLGNITVSGEEATDVVTKKGTETNGGEAVWAELDKEFG